MIRWAYAFIDRPRDRFEQSNGFWSAVTGTRLSVPRGEWNEFATLEADGADACLKIQAVGDDGGVHLDLCTEDVQGFARAAVGLGASVVADSGDLVVLRSPGGLLFCSVSWHGESARPDVAVGAGGARSRLDQVCIDVSPGAYETEVAFWAELTDWQLEQRPLPEFRVLTPPAGFPIRLLLQRLGADRPGPVRAHLDLACSDREAIRAEHEALGATAVKRGESWTVMRDPVGGIYCLTSRDPQMGSSSGPASPER